MLLRIGLLCVVAGALAWGITRYGAAAGHLVRDPERFRGYLNSYGSWGAWVFVAIQALQVIILPVPGEAVQVAGGFVYGTWWGAAYAVSGIVIGSTVGFFVGRWFGYPFLKLFVSAEGLKKVTALVNKPKAELIVMAMFLIPGIPKDILTYVAGLTPLRPLHFLAAVAVARFPGILLGCYIGAHVEEHRYVEVLIASIVAIGVFVAGVFFQDRLVNAAGRFAKGG